MAKLVIFLFKTFWKFSPTYLPEVALYNTWETKDQLGVPL